MLDWLGTEGQGPSGTQRRQGGDDALTQVLTAYQTVHTKGRHHDGLTLSATFRVSGRDRQEGVRQGLGHRQRGHGQDW